MTGPSHFAVGVATASNVVQGLILSGKVTDNGANHSLTKSGPGTLVLDNATNDFGGSGSTVDILNGVLSVSTDGALGNAANTVTLDVDGSTGVGFRATGTFSTSRTFNLNQANNAIEVTQGKTLTLTASFTLSAATNTLTKNDNGVLVLSANNSGWTGAVTINAGAIEVQNSNALGSGAITINNAIGSALLLSGGVTISNPLTTTVSSTTGGIDGGGFVKSVSGVNTYAGLITQASGAAANFGADAGATLNITGGIASSNSVNFYAGLGGVVNLQSAYGNGGAGGPTISKTGLGDLNVTASQSAVTSAITINQGTMTISGADGKFGGTGLVTVNSSGTLVLDDQASAVTNRLSGRAITLVGGNFTYLGNATASSETLGTLTVSRPGTTITVNNNGGTSTLTFASLGGTTVNAVGSDAALNFVSTGAAFGTTNNKILFTTGPTLTNNIIQRATVNGTDFATWTSGNGIAAFTGYDNSNNVNAGTTTATLNLTGNASLTASRTINAIKFNSTTGLTLSGPASGTGSVGSAAPFQLTLTAGGIIATGSTVHTISAPVLAFAAIPAFMAVDSGTTLNITSALVGSGGLNKTGAGTLILTAPASPILDRSANTLSGNVNVLSGTLRLAGGNNTLPANNFLMVGPTATVDLNGNAQTSRLFTDAAVENGGGIVTGGTSVTSTMVAIGEATSRNWAGQLIGALSFMRAGDNTLTMYSDNTYTGHTSINGGRPHPARWCTVVRHLGYRDRLCDVEYR